MSDFSDLAKNNTARKGLLTGDHQIGVIPNSNFSAQEVSKGQS